MDFHDISKFKALSQAARLSDGSGRTAMTGQRCSAARRQPGTLDLDGLPFTRPGWHGDPDGAYRLRGRSPELEVSPQRNGEADAYLKNHRLFAFPLLAPHFTTASNDKPDFLNGAMHDGMRHLARAKLEVSHAAAGQTEKDTDVRAVGRDDGCLRGQKHGGEGAHVFNPLAAYHK